MENFGIEIIECFSMDYAGNGEKSEVPPLSATPRPHAHSFYQYLYVLESSDAVIAIDNELMPVIPGNLYLIKPFVQHNVFSNQNAKTVELKFALHNPLLIDISYKLPVILPVTGTSAEKIITDLVIEYKNSSFDDPMFYVKFYELMLVLSRINGMPKKPDMKLKEYITLYNDSYRKLIDFMHDNYYRQITLDEMSELMHFEKNYFIKNFKSKFNCTPLKFLNIIRANQAMNLLEYTDTSIEEVARKTGFSGTASLTNFFRSNFYTTPTEYRNKIREKIKIKNDIP